MTFDKELNKFIFSKEEEVKDVELRLKTYKGCVSGGGRVLSSLFLGPLMGPKSYQKLTRNEKS